MIKKYFYYRRALLWLGALACTVFSSISLLAGLGLGNTLYAVLVFVFIMAVFCWFDFTAFRSHFIKLHEILESLSAAAHDYPEPSDAIEELYIEIAASLYSSMRAAKAEMSDSYAEQLDYYTMWIHQIKTPISAMRLACESESGSNPVYSQELFKIERYVEMALQYVKIQNLENDLVISKISLDAVLLASIKKYASLFIYKNLVVDFEHSAAEIITDEKWLAFIIEQLLSNAVKYTSKGGVRIYYKNSVLVIEDSGIGILQEDIFRIFEKGFTGHNGRIDKHASGLGLYMAANVSHELGMTISADSVPGRGTRMLLTFPREIDLMESNLTKL